MYKKITFANCFLIPMKKIVVLVFFLTALASCSKYQKVLKSTDNEAKLVMIDTLLNRKKYNKAITLFEQVIQQYRGTDKAPELAVKYGDALFYNGNYPTAAGQYERYADAYAMSPKVEYVKYMEGKCYAEMSAIYSRDQEYTNKSIIRLQDYINKYPNGEYVKQSNEVINNLRSKLDKKAYEIAKNYHHRNAYIPAIATLENFIAEHPGSEYQDDAHFYLLDSEYSYAIKSISSQIESRLDVALKYYDNFVRRYPESEYRADADKILAKINEYKKQNNINNGI